MRLLCCFFLLIATSLLAQHGLPSFKTPQISGPSDEATLALRSFKAAPGFQLELFAAEPLLAHPVAFAIDEQNRIYVSESFRVGVQVTDIRGHMNWLDEELASTNTAQLRRLIEKYMVKGDFMTAETERIQVLEDTDHDGKADKSTVFAEGFNDIDSGIASGVLARKGDVWFTCIPDLWRLRDTNGDGKADERKILQHGYAVRFGFYGHDLHGLRFGPDGKLYFSIGDRGLNVVTPEGRRIANPESGAVLRCNPDGSELELFATGLRNPQELAFDDYGNLFTGDNNSDGGDLARWVHLVEGGDSGWRIGYQFITSPVPRGPWNAEKMWHPQNPDQPAYILPPITNLAKGPSGLTFNPGIGLPQEYDRHFFLADFLGTGPLSSVRSFGLKARGASYEVVDQTQFITGILVTDVEFGMDGAFYISDWVQGWGKSGKGRIYRAFHPQSRANPLVEQTRELMAKGFEQRTDEELAGLLSWPDQRVRQEAQFELAARGTKSAPWFDKVTKGTNPLARLHAIWGLGQIHEGLVRQKQKLSADLLKPLVPLLDDADPEVRAQAAHVSGRGKYAPAGGALARLAVERNNPRVQFFAVSALGRVGGKAASSAITEMLRQNADEDVYLRHAGVMALLRLSGERNLASLAKDRSAAVRLAALLALRRLESPRIAVFLKDADQRLVLEAARAINDLPITKALPELAALDPRPWLQAEPVLRRIINANFRIGQDRNAAALAKLAADASVLEAVRVEALQAVGDWSKPSGRDRVTGLWRPLPPRDASIAVTALRPVLEGLLGAKSDALKAAAARAAGAYQLASPQLAALLQSETADAGARVEALRALAALKDPRFSEYLERAIASSSEMLRVAAIDLLAKNNPAAATKLLAQKLESGSTREKQGAMVALSGINDASVDSLIARQMDALLQGKLDPAVQLELLEAAEKHRRPEIEKRLAAYERARPQSEIGPFVETLHGGDAIQGRKVFFEKAEASCNRCHKVAGEGGEVGPDLTLTLTERDRAYLLESIIVPNKTIAPGFENVTVVLKNGLSYLGTLKSENATQLVLNSLEDGLVTVPKADIASRQSGLSGMQQDLAKLLSKRDLRDLVEFLATLQ